MIADVAVVGGGSAGLAAAIGAARKGAEVVLIERQGVLGGMAATAMVHSICGLYLQRDSMDSPIKFANGGFAREFAETLLKNEGARGPVRLGRLDVLMHQPSEFARLAMTLAGALPNLRVLLDTTVCSTRSYANGMIDALELEHGGVKNSLITATIVDTTGDAELASLAGAMFERSPLERLQRPAYISLLHGIAPDAMSENGRLVIVRTISYGVSDGRLNGGALGAAFRAGVHAEEVWVTIDLPGDGFDPNDARSLSLAESEGRRITKELVAFLNHEHEGFRNARIAEFPARLGVRESRRINGLYQLTEEDIIHGTRFEDEVALAAWPIELRETARGPRFRFPMDNRPCGIPLRSLRSRDIQNLFMAGRCISATHEAQASIRVIGTCMATGEAAGVAAANLVASGSAS